LSRFLFLIISLISSIAAEATAPNVQTLRLGIITPPPHKWTKTATSIAKEISVETNSELTLAIFPSGQLGNEAQMLQLLQTGAIDFAFLTTAELANRLIEFSAFYTPYIADTASHAACILHGDAASSILNSAQKIGVTGLGYGMAGLRQVVSRAPLNSLDDLKGLKVRVTADLPLTDFWKLAGAAPTAIPLSALYDAFANGQVDAMHIDFENTLRLKFSKHAETILHSDHMIFPMVAVASSKSWQSLTKEQRELLQKIFTAHLNKLLESYAIADVEFKAALIKNGATVKSVTSDFFADASQAWAERWAPRTPLIEALSKEAVDLKKRSDCMPRKNEVSHAQ